MFELLHQSNRARAGVLHLAHGDVPTPIFMPVGTQGTVKAMTPRDLEDVGAQLILGNTYHLYLRPGHEIIRRLGGLHRFMNWKRCLLTDSGGFQIYSLNNLRKIDDGGVTFRSHIDGSRHRIGPEESIAIQNALGADIIMAFDECPPYPCTRDEALQAAQRSNRWAIRSRDAHRNPDVQNLFGIIQGGVHHDLRTLCAEAITALDFPGYAIGGLSVGEPNDLMLETLSHTTALMPVDRPRYLMGVGTPADLLNGIALGVDMFDCVFPTRTARNATLFTSNGRMLLRQAKYKEDSGPIEDGCLCYACRNFSRAYLRHLFMAKEILACQLATMHNLQYYLGLISTARAAIVEDRFEEYKNDALRKMERVSDEES